MALRISKIVKEMKEFKLLKKMLKKGYINFYAGSENPCIVFSSSPEKYRGMLCIKIKEEYRISVIKQNIDGERKTEFERTTEFSSMAEAFRFVESYIWEILPKQMLEDVLEIGSYNV